MGNQNTKCAVLHGRQSTSRSGNSDILIGYKVRPEKRGAVSTPRPGAVTSVEAMVLRQARACTKMSINANLLPFSGDQTSMPHTDNVEAEANRIIPVDDPSECARTAATVHWLNFGFDVEPLDTATGKLSSFGDNSPFEHFQQNLDHVPAGKLPKELVALVFEADQSSKTYRQMLRVKPVAILVSGTRQAYLYRADLMDLTEGPVHLPEGIKFVPSGKLIKLPWGEDLDKCKVTPFKREELPMLTVKDLKRASREFAEEQAQLANEIPAHDAKMEEPEGQEEPETLSLAAPTVVALPDPPSENVTKVEEKPTLLDRFSLRGKSERIRQQIVDEAPLLGRLVLFGQLTVWYGPTNAGKTLIFISLLIQAIAEGRILGNMVYYVNADDSGAGLLTKTEILDDMGCHTIAPGYQGFDTHHFGELLTSMADNGEAKGRFVILDTAKKFFDPMHKKEVARFATICRNFALKGGTMLILGHTNKHPNANGKQQYAGTADLLQDFDAGFTIDVLSESDAEKVIEFTNNKGRGHSASSAAFAFNNEAASPYTERLASVREIDPDQRESLHNAAKQANDAEVIAALAAAIRDKSMSKMELAVFVSGQVGIGRNKVVQIIERYQGDDPKRHRWHYKTGAHGRKTYFLHASPPAD